MVRTVLCWGYVHKRIIYPDSSHICVVSSMSLYELMERPVGSQH